MATAATQDLIPARAIAIEDARASSRDDQETAARGRRLLARLAGDRARLVRIPARVLALLCLPGAVWTLWALLFATPWAEQPFVSLLGQGAWVLALLATLTGALLAFRAERGAGGLLLGLGLAMLTWAVVGRVLDAEHWSDVFPFALGCLILPTIAAGALLRIAWGLSSRQPAGDEIAA